MGVVKSITCSNGRVTAASGGTVDTADISADAVMFAKIQNVSTSRLVGRYTAGSGDLEEIALGSGFSVSGGTLTYSGGGSGTVTSVGLTAPTGLSVSGSPVTSSGTLALSWSLASGVLLGRTTAGTGNLETITVAGNLTLTGGVLTGTTSAEEVQDVIGAMVAASDTVLWSYDDVGGTLSAQVQAQMSITSDASGLKLSGDSTTPGASKYYGTDSGGSKGWHSLTSGGTVTSVGLSLPAIFSVSGSPVTASGTLTASLASQTGNLVWASPNGSSGAPTFRALVGDDLASGTITMRELGSASVTMGKIATAAVESTNLVNGAVDTVAISTGAVTSAKLADGAVVTVKIADGNVTLAKLASMTDARLLGRSAGSAGTPGEITVDTSLALSAGALSVAALGVTSAHLASNAVTTAKITDANVTTAKIADAAVTSVKIADGNVTLAKLPTFASARLIGYDGVSSTAQNLSIGSGLALSGTTLTATTTATVSSVGLSLPAIFSVSGTPVTTSGTLTATLATQSANTFLAGPQTGAAAAPTFRAISSNDLVANLVLDSNLRQSSGLSVIGRSASTTGDVADITAASDHQVLRRSGSSIGFGSVNLASSNAVTGALPVGNGGTGLTSYTTGDLVYASGSAALSKLAVGSSSQVLGVSGGVPAWRDEYAASNGSSTLASAYSITSTNSWQDTGLSVSLPAAGTYLILYNARAAVTASGGTSYIVVRLYNTTDAAAITDTERLTAFGNAAQATVSGSAIVTVAAGKTIRLDGRREGTASSWTTSEISSGAAGRTTLSYIRLY